MKLKLKDIKSQILGLAKKAKVNYLLFEAIENARTQKELLKIYKENILAFIKMGLGKDVMLGFFTKEDLAANGISVHPYFPTKSIDVFRGDVPFGRCPLEPSGKGLEAFWEKVTMCFPKM